MEWDAYRVFGVANAILRWMCGNREFSDALQLQYVKINNDLREFPRLVYFYSSPSDA